MATPQSASPAVEDPPGCTDEELQRRIQERTADLFRLAVGIAPSGILMIDRDGAIVLANAQVEKRFG